VLYFAIKHQIVQNPFLVSSHSSSLRSPVAAPWVPRRTSIHFLDHNRFFRVVNSSSSSSIIVGIIPLSQFLNAFLNLRRALRLLMLLRLENATNELTRLKSHMHVDALLGQDSWSVEQHNEYLGRILGRCKLGLRPSGYCDRRKPRLVNDK
jgi:hypothetical protein